MSMCHIRFESIESDGDNTLYNLYFDNVLVRTGLTLDEVIQEISRKGESNDAVRTGTTAH